MSPTILGDIRTASERGRRSDGTLRTNTVGFRVRDRAQGTFGAGERSFDRQRDGENGGIRRDGPDFCDERKVHTSHRSKEVLPRRGGKAMPIIIEGCRGQSWRRSVRLHHNRKVLADDQVHQTHPSHSTPTSNPPYIYTTATMNTVLSSARIVAPRLLDTGSFCYCPAFVSNAPLPGHEQGVEQQGRRKWWGRLC